MPSKNSSIRPAQRAPRGRGSRCRDGREMATIDDLPAEILHQILDILRHNDSCVIEDLGEPEHEALYESNLATLNSASLVARRWQAPAQSSLWKRLLVSNDSHLKQLLANLLLGTMRTDELEVTGSACSSKMLGELVGRMIGLKSLRILPSYGVDGLVEMAEDSWLGSPALRGTSDSSPLLSCRQQQNAHDNKTDLNFLCLGVGVANANASLSTTTYGHLNLSHLEIGTGLKSPSTTRAILQSPNLKYLSLAIYDPILHPTLLSAFPIFGPSLQRLDLHTDILHVELYTHHLTSLQKLVYTCYTVDSLPFADRFIKALPSQEKQLEIYLRQEDNEMGFDPDFPAKVLSLWERGRWEGLSLLSLDALEREVMMLPRGWELLDLCEKWDVEVDFSDSNYL
ncbi:hypothetical protein P7C70_g4735, partial [Phenoliferia sp. Uapishka_3]